ELFRSLAEVLQEGIRHMDCDGHRFSLAQICLYRERMAANTPVRRIGYQNHSPRGSRRRTDSRSRHTIKQSFRPSDQVSSTPYLPSPVSPFHGEPLFSRSASVWPLGQGASSCGQKKSPAMFESTSTVP